MLGHSGGNAGPKQSQFSTADARPGGAKASAPDHPASAGASASLVKMTMQAGGGCARAAKAPPRCVQRLWLSFFVSGEVAVSNAGFPLCTLPASLTISVLCNRDQPNTTHTGGPLRHGMQNDVSGATSAPAAGGAHNSLRGSVGGAVATLQMASSPAGLASRPGGFELRAWSEIPGGLPQEDTVHRSSKRQRAGEAVIVSVEGQEVNVADAEWAAGCFAEPQPSGFESDVLL